MHKTSTLLLTVLLLFFHSVHAQKEAVVFMTTSYGTMAILLYDETPQHKENFLKLVEEGFYTDLLFHRVIDEFMIQGGDPDSKDAASGQALGGGDVGYTVPAEFVPELIHKKGALAAARMGDNVNPEKASSGCQFYIVQGRTFSDEELNGLALRTGKEYTEEQRQMYNEVGGTPHLDGSYTVFGEVISGFEIIDAIASVDTDNRDRPTTDISMRVEIKQMKRSKVTKEFGYEFPN